MRLKAKADECTYGFLISKILASRGDKIGKTYATHRGPSLHIMGAERWILAVPVLYTYYDGLHDGWLVMKKIEEDKRAEVCTTHWLSK